MQNGMLWFDNDPQTTLEQKIQKAVDYYTTRFGTKPNTCLVHPSALGKPITLNGLTVKPYLPVMPGHLWIGMEDNTPPSWKTFTGRFGPDEIIGIQDSWEHRFDKIVDELLICDPIVTLRAMIEIMINSGYVGDEPKFDSLLKNEELSKHWAKFLTDKDTDDRDRGYSLTLLVEMNKIST